MTGKELLKYLMGLSQSQLDSNLMYFDDCGYFHCVDNVQSAEEDHIQIYDLDYSKPRSEYTKEEVENILDNDEGYISCQKDDIVLYSY